MSLTSSARADASSGAAREAAPLELSWVSDQRVGVALIRGQVQGHVRPFIAELTLHHSSGVAITHKVLVTKRGRILELIRTPESIVDVSFGPADQALGLTVELSLRHQPWWAYRYRQLRRIAPVFYRQPRQRRLQVGLSVDTVVSDLDAAYALACRFRANIYGQAYTRWVEEFHALLPRDRRQIAHQMRAWRLPPEFDIVVLSDSPDMAVAAGRSYASVKAQVYPRFTLAQMRTSDWLAREHARPADPAAPAAPVTWRIVLRAGTQLAPHALYWLAYTSIAAPDATLIYTDEDTILPSGDLAHPVFKPDWSKEYLRATNYIGEAFAWRDLADGQGGRARTVLQEDSPHAWHAWLLALTARAASAVSARTASPHAGAAGHTAPASRGDHVVHVPVPLWHAMATRPPAASGAGNAEATARVVQHHLDAIGIDADVEPLPPVSEVFESSAGFKPLHACRVRYRLPSEPPLVSIIIPTRDGMAHLQPCVDSLLAMTNYPRFEIIVMDNQSVLPETHAYFEAIQRRPGVRVMAFDEPFNYSRINNRAASHAHGDLLCLLNNDTEVISPDWLDEMVGRVLQSEVGAVGAKLLFGDGTVQHAGDTVGPGGCADHLNSGIDRHAPGYQGRALVAQDFSAVTAACLLTHAHVYRELGGLDEVNLPVAFNDVDYCLRVREAGLSVVWTPHALLYHHESVSRGKDVTPAQLARAQGELAWMRKRWGHVMHHDPFYNPNLNYLQPDFALSAIPRVTRPWLRR